MQEASSYTKTLSELKTIEDRLKYLLDKNPELRDMGVNFVVAKFWSTFDNLDVSPQFLSKLTNMESIRRCKQKIVERWPDLYGPQLAKTVEGKNTKQTAFAEYAVSDKL